MLWNKHCQHSLSAYNILCKFTGESVYRHISFYCPSLYCASQILHFFFNKLKVCGKSVSTKSVSTNFPTALTLCACHIFVIFTMFQIFFIMLLLWVSVISNLVTFDVTIVFVWGSHKPSKGKTEFNPWILCMFWWLYWLVISLTFFLFSGLPIC